MIRIKTNIGKIVELNVARLQKLAETDQMLRTAATQFLGQMKTRIHENGLDANNRPIGTYSPGYMTLRLGTYQNGKVFVTRGVNKGNIKKQKRIGDAGVFSKGINKGKVRPKYNVDTSPKVILSLTRTMENDESVIALRNNSYGIGFSNKDNYDKSQWVEETYHLEGKIFAVSANEQQAVIDIVKQFTQDALSG
jgi:hypothetical protein